MKYTCPVQGEIEEPNTSLPWNDPGFDRGNEGILVYCLPCIVPAIRQMFLPIAVIPPKEATDD
jgi:hypothetical protein